MYFLLNLIVFLLIEQVLVVAHEGGHALAAKLMRFRVLSVWIGYGKRLGSITAFGIPVLFHAIPIGGHTLAAPQSRSWFRLRLWIFIAAGPVVHIFLLIATFSLFPEIFDVGHLVNSYLTDIAPLEVFIFCNVLLFLLSVVPRTANIPVGPISTDGQALLQVPFWKEGLIDEFFEALPRLEANELFVRGEREKALAILEAELPKHPNNKPLIHELAVMKLRDGDHARAHGLFLDLLDAPEFERPELQATLKNNIAWTAAVLWRDDVLEQADRFSLDAFNFMPGYVLFKGTRAAVLIRLGRYREGVAMLKDVYKLQSRPDARAAEACFLAIGHAGLGNTAESIKWLRKARENDPEYPLIVAAKREIERLEEQR